MKRQKAPHKNATLRDKVIPALLASFSVSILIFILYYVNFDISYGKGASAILFASFGASAFILFLTPKLKIAKPANFIKAYILGGIVGLGGFYLLDLLPFYAVAGIAVFALSLLMYLFDCLHPPAVGIALAFVLYRINVYGILIVALGAIILIFLRIIFERFVYLVEEDVIKEIDRK